MHRGLLSQREERERKARFLRFVQSVGSSELPSAVGHSLQEVQDTLGCNRTAAIFCCPLLQRLDASPMKDGLQQ